MHYICNSPRIYYVIISVGRVLYTPRNTIIHSSCNLGWALVRSVRSSNSSNACLSSSQLLNKNRFISERVRKLGRRISRHPHGKFTQFVPLVDEHVGVAFESGAAGLVPSSFVLHSAFVDPASPEGAPTRAEEMCLIESDSPHKESYGQLLPNYSRVGTATELQ
eukprot:5805515-Amphidinium_carterae.1